jgi:hypothetical protein
VRQINSVADSIGHLAELHEQREQQYGADYLRAGSSLMGMFPDGLALRCEADFTRFGLLNRIHDKLLRYAANFGTGGHADTLDDISVYAQLLKHADEVNERGK